uniref:Uncharacterized protein n=1 Tax=Oryza punctata TaxID=4537 RepID=A0A0E0JKD8_ORYPU
MYLQRPTRETRKRRTLRLLLQQLQLQHCRPHLPQLLRLQILLLQLLHPKECFHQYLKTTNARSTSGCWKRSGRSSHAMLLRRTRSAKRRRFSRSSSGQSLSLVCD